MGSKNPLYSRRRKNQDNRADFRHRSQRDRHNKPETIGPIMPNNWDKNNDYEDTAEKHSPKRRSHPMEPSISTLPPQWQNNPIEGNMMYLNVPYEDSGANMIPEYSINHWPDSSGIGFSAMAFPDLNHSVPRMDLEAHSNNVSGMRNFSMTPDQSMFGVSSFSEYQGEPKPWQDKAFPIKKTYYFPRVTLCPPDPEAPLPRIREKPHGCRTLFVGDLPERITSSMVVDIFSKYGEMEDLEMNPTNCRIRYTEPQAVDAALSLSGYQIVIDETYDPSSCGTIYVRYARSEKDQREYDCKQRALERERRHNGREAEERNKKPSIVPYSYHNISTVTENLRNEVKFKTAVGVLIAWLERGECNKKSAGYFFSMLQSTNSVISDLLTKKEEMEKESEAAKIKLNEKIYNISLQLNDIEKVFEAARLQKAWDHFSKVQRKSILLWQMHHTNTKKMISTELVEDRVEDKMDLCDDEDKANNQTEKIKSEAMQQQVDFLQQQLKAAETKSSEEKKEGEEKYLKLWKSLRDKDIELNKTKTELEETNKKLMDVLSSDPTMASKIQNELNVSSSSSCSDTNAINKKEAKIITLVATFLNVHPFGANIDYICSYLGETIPDSDVKDVESILRKYSTVFTLKTRGVGSKIQKRWVYLGYENHTSEVELFKIPSPPL